MAKHRYKVDVAIASSGRFVPLEFGMAVAGFQYPMGCSHILRVAKGLPRAQARNELCQLAIKEAEYILFLDDDTVSPISTVNHLVTVLDQADEDVIACGGIYTTKTPPPAPLVFKERHGGSFYRWQYGDVFPCFGLGAGCLMIRTSALEKLPQPWFRDIATKDEVGEDLFLFEGSPPENIGVFWMTDDMYFCTKAEDHGFKILAHGGVLPVHYQQDGQAYVMPENSLPIKDHLEKIWYRTALSIREKPAPDDYMEHVGNNLPNGWLTVEEAQCLSELARDKRVLELGAYKGRSTVCMARVAAQIVSVDHHTGDPQTRPIPTKVVDTLSEFLRNIAEYPNVVPIVCDIRAIESLFAPGIFDLVFIDASHTFEHAKRDFLLARRFGKMIVAHDWYLFDVAKAATAVDMSPTRIVGSLAIFE